MHTDKRDVSLEVDLSFCFEKQANKLGIGTKMGGNVSEFVYEKYSNERGKVGFIFELTDSPLDNYAEDLFAVYEECLMCRMQKVQKLFESLLNHGNIRQITFEVNYLFGENADEICIEATDFCKTAMALYNENDDVNPPIIKFSISKTVLRE